MAYEVITHGGGEGLVNTFNAVAAIFNGKRGLGASIVYIAGSFATAMAVMSLVIKQELMPTAKWFFGSLIIMTTLTLPKTDIIVKDRITRLEQPVSHVPFLLGAFAGIATQLGDVMAKKMDSIFSVVGNGAMSYRDHGVAMASQLAAKAENFTIQNPDAAANIHAFVQQCMVFDIAKGKYTIQELVKAEDTWGFLKEQASPIRGFPYRMGKKDTQIITCKQAVPLIDKGWAHHTREASVRYGTELFSQHKGVSNKAAELLSNLELSYQYLTGLSIEANAILRQHMMRNVIKESLLELNQTQDATAAITAYAVTRAEAQQKTAYALQGSMASLALSTLKVVVEVLFYGIFPIIVAIAVFPGGLEIVKKYLIALFWIQSWAPMYAILNMLVNVYGRAKSIAAVTITEGTSTKGVLALSTIPRLGEANEWISAVAGYAMMSVPFLSYAIIHYGAGALSQLATHFGSVTQSSASHAAEEATTGNYSLGNTSFDNHNRHNTSAFKYDTNASVATGKLTTQRLDGSLLHQMPDGKQYLDMTPALPKLNSSIKMSDQLANSFNESANKSVQAGLQETEAATKNISSAFNTLDEFRKNRGSDVHSSTGYSEQEQAFRETAFSQYYDLVSEFAKSHHIDKTAALEIFGQVGMGLPGTKCEGGIRGSFRAADNNIKREAETYAEKEGMSELLRQSISEAKEGRLNLTDVDGNNYGESIASSLSKVDGRMQSAQAHFSEAESYQEQANFIQQNGVNMEQDLTKQYWENLVGDLGLEKAEHIVKDPVLNNQHMKSFSDEKRDQLRQQFEKNAPTNAAMVEKKYQEDSEMVKQKIDVDKTASENTAAVTHRAKEKGLTTPIDTSRRERVKKNLGHTQQEIGNKGKETKDKGELLKPGKMVTADLSVDIHNLPPD